MVPRRGRRRLAMVAGDAGAAPVLLPAPVLVAARAAEALPGLPGRRAGRRTGRRGRRLRGVSGRPGPPPTRRPRGGAGHGRSPILPPPESHDAPAVPTTRTTLLRLLDARRRTGRPGLAVRPFGRPSGRRSAQGGAEGNAEGVPQGQAGREGRDPPL